MCNLFIHADESLWQSQTRSLRIDGVVTSIRLELFFWTTLNEIASRDELSVPQLISKLYLEALDAGHDIGNFTSFLRVCCSRYLSLIADKLLLRNQQSALEDVDATKILLAEKQKTTEREKSLNKVSPRHRLN